MRRILILTTTLALLLLGCQAHTQSSDLRQIEMKGHVLSGKAQALIDQNPEAKDSMWGFKDSSGQIFRVPQSSQPQQTGPSGCEDKTGNMLLLPGDTK